MATTDSLQKIQDLFSQADAADQADKQVGADNPFAGGGYVSGTGDALRQQAGKLANTYFSGLTNDQIAAIDPSTLGQLAMNFKVQGGAGLDGFNQALNKIQAGNPTAYNYGQSLYDQAGYGQSGWKQLSNGLQSVAVPAAIAAASFFGTPLAGSAANKILTGNSKLAVSTAAQNNQDQGFNNALMLAGGAAGYANGLPNNLANSPPASTPNQPLPAGGMTTTGSLSPADAQLMGVGGGATGAGAGYAGLTDAAIGSGLAGASGGVGLGTAGAGLSGAAAGGNTLASLTGTGANTGGLFGSGGVLGTGLTTGQAVLGGGQILGGIYGANQASNAAQSAADTSAAATNASTALQSKMFDQNQANMQPWLDAGKSALASQQELLANPSSYQQSPYDAWLQQQGSDALNASAAAKGNLNSGNTLAALLKYGQGMAGQGYNDQFNRYGAISGTGQTTANQMANNSTQYANNVGNLNMANANTQGNATLAGTSAQNQMIGNSLNSLSNLYGQSQQNQYNQQLLNAIHSGSSY